MLRRLRPPIPVGALLVLTAAAGCAPEVEERIGVSYDDRFDATRMDVYLPKDDGRARPAILFVHGGGWRGGDPEYHRPDAERMAGSGFVAATVGYRLIPEGQFPAAYQDVHCALAYVRAHADELGVDGDRIAIAGMSAGGHLVSLLGVAADEPAIATDCEWGPTGPPAAVISAAGPTDLRPRADAEHIQEFVGGTIEEVPEAYDLASPMYHVDGEAPPFLFVHGTFDVFVDLDDSRLMQEALLSEGNDARLLTLPAGGHLLNPGSGAGDLQIDIPLTSPEAWPVIADFLDSTMGGPDA